MSGARMTARRAAISLRQTRCRPPLGNRAWRRSSSTCRSGVGSNLWPGASSSAPPPRSSRAGRLDRAPVAAHADPSNRGSRELLNDSAGRGQSTALGEHLFPGHGHAAAWRTVVSCDLSATQIVVRTDCTGGACPPPLAGLRSLLVVSHRWIGGDGVDSQRLPLQLRGALGPLVPS